MPERRKRIAVALLLLAAMGCHTVPIPEPYVIELPSEMTAQQAEVAVLAGIFNSPPPGDYDPKRPLSEAEFEAMIWKGFISVSHGRSWFVESREGNTIYTAVNTRGLYLRAAVVIEAETIRISIVESRELDQSESRIHKRAIKWLRNLDAHIRREVGRMAVVIGRSA